MRTEIQLQEMFETAKQVMVNLGFKKEDMDVEIKLNGRLKAIVARSFKDEKIDISREYFNHAKESDIINTLIHELCHQLDNSDEGGHGKRWQEISEIVNNNTSYKIFEFCKQSELEYRNYLPNYSNLECVDCERTGLVRRKKGLSTQDYIEKYICNTCLGKLREVIR